MHQRWRQPRWWQCTDKSRVLGSSQRNEHLASLSCLMPLRKQHCCRHVSSVSWIPIVCQAHNNTGVTKLHWHSSNGMPCVNHPQSCVLQQWQTRQEHYKETSQCKAPVFYYSSSALAYVCKQCIDFIAWWSDECNVSSASQCCISAEKKRELSLTICCIYVQTCLTCKAD